MSTCVCGICDLETSHRKTWFVKDFHFVNKAITGRVCKTHHGVTGFVQAAKTSETYEREQHMSPQHRVRTPAIKKKHKARKVHNDLKESPFGF